MTDKLPPVEIVDDSLLLLRYPDRDSGELVELRVRVKLPRSRTARIEAVAAASVSAIRAHGAALGLCWSPGKGRPRARLAKSRWDVLAYGAEVADELLDRGLPFDALLQAGDHCLALITRSIAELDEVADRADFSGPGEERSTSSS